jgi:heavy metal efflux system protein
MNRELEKIPGVIWNFSQPISDNMEEAVSGVKGRAGHQDLRRPT